MRGTTDAAAAAKRISVRVRTEFAVALKSYVLNIGRKKGYELEI